MERVQFSRIQTEKGLFRVDGKFHDNPANIEFSSLEKLEEEGWVDITQEHNMSPGWLELVSHVKYAVASELN
ncbi:hypothetical protein [Algicola sagamiensis]|uniref:hypothetical protein n=1 Tax=Algicola sagamiensis TaxID=163869 RepID=UPI00039B72D9|nr:hypothetical protein [Algicola sagamiensis]